MRPRLRTENPEHWRSVIGQRLTCVVELGDSFFGDTKGVVLYFDNDEVVNLTSHGDYGADSELIVCDGELPECSGRSASTPHATALAPFTSSLPYCEQCGRWHVGQCWPADAPFITYPSGIHTDRLADRYLYVL